MEKVKIKKAKLKDDLFLEVEYTEELPGHSKKDTKLSCTVPVHDDLKESFQKLHKHLAALCDEISVKGKLLDAFDHNDFAQFFVRGFTIAGTDENEGVTVSGYKTGKFGNVNLNTPFTKWESNDYPFVGELAIAVEGAVYEVEEYLFNGKRAPEKQIEMDFGAEEETYSEESR